MAVSVNDRAQREIDEAWLEELRRDPAVVVRRRKTRDPFVSPIRVDRRLDVLELIGRCDDDGVETGPERRGRA